MGNFHYQGSPAIDDVLLAENLVDRMYDVLADEEKFRQHDQWIGRFAASLDQSRPYTTREFLYLLGLELGKHCKEDGIVSAAAKAGIPLYCPAVADSSIGIGIAANRYEGGNRFTFDVIGDVVETARIVAESEATGVIYFGGGTPKNFVQQTEVTAIIMNTGVTGHKYAIQCVTDSPHWGGLSGCTFEEAQSWGKIAKDASMVTCHSDSTIAMPILVSALLEHRELVANRHRPSFTHGPGTGGHVMSALKIPMYQVDAFAGQRLLRQSRRRLSARNLAAGCPDAGHRRREQSGRDSVLRAQRRRLQIALVHAGGGSGSLRPRHAGLGVRHFERSHAGRALGFVRNQERHADRDARRRPVFARFPVTAARGLRRRVSRPGSSARWRAGSSAGGARLLRRLRIGRRAPRTEAGHARADDDRSLRGHRHRARHAKSISSRASSRRPKASPKIRSPARRIARLIPYWSKRLGKKKLHAYQVSPRGGELWCEDRGERVTMSGKAVRFFEGTIFL